MGELERIEGSGFLVSKNGFYMVYADISIIEPGN
jgi:hypothetical protein